MIKKIIGMAILLLVSNVIAAQCPNADSSDLTEVQRAALQARVETRWEALQDKDIAASYAYATPNYRQIFSQDLYQVRYVGGGDRQLQTLAVGQLQQGHPVVVEVKTRVLTLSPLNDRIPSNENWDRIPVLIMEKWVCTQDEWWYHPRP